KKTSDISYDLDMPLRVVQRVLHTWQEIGEVCHGRKGRGSARLLKDCHMKHLVAPLEHSPDLYLDEIQLQLFTQYNVEVSLATVYRSLKRLGYSQKKKLSKAAAERMEHLQVQFAVEIGKYPPEFLVCADEAAVNIHTTYRTNGWS
ncbi:hypothetical protein K435DRAFT_604637, partial [Dendrothele bispora CBS 962.96]